MTVGGPRGADDRRASGTEVGLVNLTVKKAPGATTHTECCESVPERPRESGRSYR